MTQEKRYEVYIQKLAAARHISFEQARKMKIAQQYKEWLKTHGESEDFEEWQKQDCKD